MTKKFDVYGVGNAIVDFQLAVSEEDIRHLKLEKGAMRLVTGEEQRQIFSYLGARIDKQASGGSAANTMIALAQLGSSGAYACMVGEDALGEFYFEEMKQIGVSLHTKPKAGLQTGTSLILITPDAERTMNTNLGASVELQSSDVNEQAISQSAWLYVEGYLFAQENGRAVAARSIELAKRHGCKIALTVSDGFIVDVFREPLEAAIKSTDLLFANRNEGSRLTSMDASASEKEIFEELCARVPNVALTLGSEGVLCRFEGETCKVPGVPTKAIDDTGAGDMFAGAFLHGIATGWGCEQSAKLGCLLASKVVSQMGPRLSGELRRYREE